MQVTLDSAIVQHLQQLTDRVNITDNAFNIQNKNINTVCILRKIYLYSIHGAPIVGDQGCDIISGFPDDVRSAYLGDGVMTQLYQGANAIVAAKLKSLMKLGLITLNPDSPEYYQITSKGVETLKYATGCHTDSYIDNHKEVTGIIMIATTVMDSLTSECTYVRGFDNDQGNAWYGLAQKVDGMIRNPCLKDPVKCFNFLKHTIDKLLQIHKFKEEIEELQLAKNSIEDFLNIEQPA